MSAFDTSLPFPSGGTGSVSRNMFGFSKESHSLGLLGNEHHTITNAAIQTVISHINSRNNSKKLSVQKKNMISLLLFKIAVLGLAPGENAETIIRNLVENGADVRIKNRGGATPLMMACLFGNFEMVPALLTYPSVAGDEDRAERNASDYMIEGQIRDPHITSAEITRINSLIRDAIQRNIDAQRAELTRFLNSMKTPTAASTAAANARVAAGQATLDAINAPRVHKSTSESLANGHRMFGERIASRKRKSIRRNRTRKVL